MGARERERKRERERELKIKIRGGGGGDKHATHRGAPQVFNNQTKKMVLQNHVFKTPLTIYYFTCTWDTCGVYNSKKRKQ